MWVKQVTLKIDFIDIIRDTLGQQNHLNRGNLSDKLT